VEDEEKETRVARIEEVQNEEEDDWVEKAVDVAEDDDDDVGPLPLYVPGAKGNRPGGYVCVPSFITLVNSIDLREREGGL
jgi:hypothetical protein